MLVLHYEYNYLNKLLFSLDVCVFTAAARPGTSSPCPRRGSWSTQGTLAPFCGGGSSGEARAGSLLRPGGGSRSASTRVWTRGSSAGGAVSHSPVSPPFLPGPRRRRGPAPGRSLPPPRPRRWPRGAPEPPRGTCSRSPSAAEAGVTPSAGPAPRLAPQPGGGWRSGERGESPGPPGTRLAAPARRAAAGAGLPSTPAPGRPALPQTRQPAAHSPAHGHTLPR